MQEAIFPFLNHNITLQKHHQDFQLINHAYEVNDEKSRKHNDASAVFCYAFRVLTNAYAVFH
jgi:hypothetical protein